MAVRAMVLLPARSGIPRDRVVNTFHFAGNFIPTIDRMDALRDKIASFYNGQTDGTQPSTGIAHYLSGVLDRAPDKCVIKFYQTADPTPRPLRGERTFTLGLGVANPPLPSEAAVCVSYFADRNLAGRRGRIFVGPLNAFAIDEDTLTKEPKVKAGLTAAAAAAALRLLLNPVPNAEWVVNAEADAGDPDIAGDFEAGRKARKSPAGEFPVTAGWVDNEFDTQRRRGRKATARTTW